MDKFILIEKLKRGDEEAFKQIVESWKDLVYNTAIGFLQNAQDAEDITQEVFLEVFESVKNFKAEAKFTTWLYRITVSKALDHLRRKKRKKRFAFVQSLFGPNNETVVEKPDFNHPGIKLDNKERAAILFKAIDRLPENQKTAFTLHKIEGLSYQEISEVMNTTVSAIESLIHRARQNLKKWLTDYYKGSGSSQVLKP
ncbi:MAG: RNA polymerase subunit sigma-70 [Chitinophagaceae bacterium]